MLLVDAHVGLSSIHGLGLIAREDIPAGATVSRHEPGLDLALSQEELDALPPPARQTYRYYSFRHVDTLRYVLSFDDDRFTNHSDDPNTDGRRAVRPIRAGEELTSDYRRWDLDCEWKLASTTASSGRTLGGADPGARLAVLRVVARVRLADPAVVPAIAAALGDPDRSLRYAAAKALARVGPPAASAATALAGALTGADAEVRYFAAKCLARTGPGAASAVPALAASLGDRDPRVRYYCAKALGGDRPRSRYSSGTAACGAGGPGRGGPGGRRPGCGPDRGRPWGVTGGAQALAAARPPRVAARADLGGGVERAVVGCHRDAEGHWVAELGCGHGRHVRHDPPWEHRPWVVTPEGRQGRLGARLDCVKCDRGEPPDRPA